jgi:hypothetical protein
MNARIGARPFLAWSEYELARARAARRGTRVDAEIAASVGRAREIAAALGMKRLTRHADAFAATLGAPA